jgi:chemotaxis protein MotA
MDIATVVGLVASVGLILWSMENAAGLGAFIDVTSIAIVLGGSILVLLMRSRLNDFIAMWSKVIMKTIFVGVDKPADLIEQIIEMAILRAKTDSSRWRAKTSKINIWPKE